MSNYIGDTDWGKPLCQCPDECLMIHKPNRCNVHNYSVLNFKYKGKIKILCPMCRKGELIKDTLFKANHEERFLMLGIKNETNI